MSNGWLQTIMGIEEHEFWVVQKVLEASWEWDLHTGVVKHWISFLRCMS